jgi:hypothetical protein
MAVIAFRQFDGEIPKLGKWELPDTCAQYSYAVDHTKGYLSPVKGGLLDDALTSTSGGIIKGAYTGDGIVWYSWDTETYAFKGPVVNDVHGRMYYLQPGGNLKVAQEPHIAGASATGGAPVTSFNVGVPIPTVAPALALVARTTLPDYAGAAFTFRGWWEYNGVRSQAGPLTGTQVTWMERYTVVAPAYDGSDLTDEETPRPLAVFVVEATLAAGSQKLFTLSTRVSAATPSRSQALPGGIEMTMESTGGLGYTVVFNWGIIETRAYTYTIVNQYDEESQPAPAVAISPTYLQDVQISTTQPSSTGYKPFSSTNIYRTFGASTTYVKCTVSFAGNNSPTVPTVDVWRDTTSGTTQAGATLQSTLWAAPPTGLAGIEYVVNGWFAAYKGNTLYMNEPYRPSAWPYSMAFATNIRGIKAGAQGLVVTTADACYLVAGAHPASANQMKLPVPQSGVSQRTMANIDGVVVFASPDGIVVVNGSQATLQQSHMYFNRADWQSLYANVLRPVIDATWRFASYDGKLIAVSSTGAYGFMMSLDEGEGSTFTRLPLATHLLTYVPVLDRLFYSVGTNLYAFGGSATALTTSEWWSKEFTLPAPTKFAAMKIRGVSGLFQIRVYANDVVVYDGLVTLESASTPVYFRLPSKLPADRWSVRISSLSTDVYECYLGGSYAELKSV